QRVWKQVGVESDSAGYAAERHVRDGARLVGAFDGDGELLYWNLHAGGSNPIGRLEVDESDGFPVELAPPDTVAAAVAAAAQEETWAAIASALGSSTGTPMVVVVANAAPAL